MEEGAHVLSELGYPGPVQPFVAEVHQNPHKVPLPKKLWSRQETVPAVSLMSETVCPGHLVALVSRVKEVWPLELDPRGISGCAGTRADPMLTQLWERVAEEAGPHSTRVHTRFSRSHSLPL